jgi:hypothetical protein
MILAQEQRPLHIRFLPFRVCQADGQETTHNGRFFVSFLYTRPIPIRWRRLVYRVGIKLASTNVTVCMLTFPLGLFLPNVSPLLDLNNIGRQRAQENPMKTLLYIMLLLAGTASVHAVTIYDVNLPIQGGGITGTLQTDGTLGPLLNENFIAYNLIFDDGVDTQVVTDTFPDTFLSSNGLLKASADDLILDFTNPSSANPFDIFQIVHNGLATGPGEAFLFDASLGTGGANPSPSGYFMQHLINVHTNNAEILHQIDEVGFALGEVSFGTVQPTVVPTPAALPLFLASLAGLGVMRRRKLKVQLAA